MKSFCRQIPSVVFIYAAWKNMNKNLRGAHQSPVKDNDPLVLYTESRAASLNVNFNDCGLDSKHLSITKRLTYTQRFNHTQFKVNSKRMLKVT